MEHSDTKVINHMNNTGRYPCNKCEKQFSNQGNLNMRNKSAHGGIKFPCSDCSYKATTKQTLIQHIQSIHEGGFHVICVTIQ